MNSAVALDPETRGCCGPNGTSEVRRYLPRASTCHQRRRSCRHHARRCRHCAHCSHRILTRDVQAGCTLNREAPHPSEFMSSELSTHLQAGLTHTQPPCTRMKSGKNEGTEQSKACGISSVKIMSDRSKSSPAKAPSGYGTLGKLNPVHPPEAAFP